MSKATLPAVVAALAQLEVRPDDRVLIMLPDGPGFTETLIGVVQRGAVPLPLNPHLTAYEVAAVALETDARLVIASAERIHALADLDTLQPVLLDPSQDLWAAVLRRC